MTEWQPISTAPRTGRKIMVAYKNSLDHWRIVLAFYAQAKTLDANHEYLDGDEDGYAPEGWYEDGEAYSEALLPTDKPPIYWMPLPEPPK